jgi:copper chaperone CopZ
MTKIELTVRGLHCEGCERSLETAVRRLDGVVSAKADRPAKRLVVELLPGHADAAAIRRRVEEAGFEGPE